MPVTPVESGRPVRLVATPDAGVPSAGAVIVGEVKVLLVSVSVEARPTSVSLAAGNVNVYGPPTGKATVAPLAAPVVVRAPPRVSVPPMNEDSGAHVLPPGHTWAKASVGVTANRSSARSSLRMFTP